MQRFPDVLGGSAFDSTSVHLLNEEAPAAQAEAVRRPMDTSVPVLILGGKENSVSLARSYGRLGITVRASGPANCWALYSRHCREKFRIPFRMSPGAYWRGLLLSDKDALHGHIILPCSDEAIEFVAQHRAELAQRYILGDGDAALQLALLDKQKTLDLAHAAGVGSPRYWPVGSEADLERLRAEISFPVMVKPIHSHKFIRVFGRKLFIVESFDELSDKVRLAQHHQLETTIVEMIPGPDDLLSSYYTYIDRNGRHLFQYTKRIIRRYPTNRGGACYHVTEWHPETAEAGRKFFDAIGFRGLGNVEFKRDRRDGQLKVIEINGRFTAAQELIVRSGAPIDLVVYCHLTNQPIPLFSTYEQHLRFWYPFRDFLAFLELRRRGELTFAGWLASVLPHRKVLPLASLRDPMPILGAGGALFQRLVRGVA